MTTFCKVVAIFGLLALSTSVFGNAVTDALDEAGVNYIYSSYGKLIVLKTKRTAEAVDSMDFPEGTEIIDYTESFEAAASRRVRDVRQSSRRN